MSSTDSNLLTFLKKQSLFSGSPSKNVSRKRSSRSKSREAKPTPSKLDDNFSNFNNYPQPTNYTTPTNAISNNNLSNLNYSNSNRNFQTPIPERILLQPSNHREYSPIQQISSNKVNTPSVYNESRFKPLEEFEERRQIKDQRDLRDQRQLRDVKNPEERGQVDKAKFWSGLVSYSTSFQSAKVESVQCLENLSNKLRNEIYGINYKIDAFNDRMLKAINGEFKTLKDRIYHIVEEVFKDSDKYIREYMKSQEEKLSGDLIRMREQLHQEFVKIEAMKEEIAKPNWRKVAGEIISSELEQKIDHLTRRSASLQIGKWELGDLVGYRLKDLDKDLRDVVRLKRDAPIIQ